jgi:hypothetical protein
VKGKADDDYDKRKNNPLGVEPDSSTFVFVTPHRWSQKEKWVREKTNDGFWRHVKAFDADDLETWLEQAPAVHIWFSSLLGKRPVGMRDLCTAWEDWAFVTTPQLSAELMMAGREGVSEQIAIWLKGSPSTLSLWAESREEALATFAATVEMLPLEEREAIFARTVVVDQAEIWHSLVASDSNLILIPMFDSRSGVTRPTREGHHVLIPLGRSDATSENAVEVTRMFRSQAKLALSAMGISDARATYLAGLARRSMMSLRRALSENPEVHQPAWAQPAEAGPLIPAMLVGTWNATSEGDRELIGRLARTTYENASRIFERWRNESDPPLRRVGDTWILVSHEDAWDLLGRFITPEELVIFTDAAVEVLSAPHPKFDLPIDDRWAAALHGVSSRYSGFLVEGLAQTLAILGSRTTSSSHSIPKYLVGMIVGKVLDSANKDWRIWASLSGVLPLLAEAAPNEFLTAVEENLKAGEPVIMELFAEGKDTMFSGALHSGLLWALEGLAWSPEYLAHATLLLAKLARLDPGGRYANRPENSLVNAFRLVMPQTTASLTSRLEVIDLLRSRAPGVSWNVLENLLSMRRSGNFFPSHQPRWRDWAPVERPTDVDPDYEVMYRAVLDRLITDAGTDGSRWAGLVGRLPNIPAEQRVPILKGLECLQPAGLPTADRVRLWDAIRSVEQNHLRFGGRAFTLSDDEFAILMTEKARFAPADPVLEFASLFSNTPQYHLWNVENMAQAHAAHEEAKLQAAIAIIAGGDNEYLRASVDEVESAYSLGDALGRVGLEADRESELLRHDSRSERLKLMLRGYTGARFRTQGWEWAQTLSDAESRHWTTEQYGEFYIGLPWAAATWDYLSSVPTEVQSYYWRNVPARYIPDIEESEKAAAQLLQYGRPHEVVDMLAMHANNTERLPSPKLVAELLFQAIRVPPPAGVFGGGFGYAVSQLFSVLDRSGDLDDETLAWLELPYVRILDESTREPKALYRLLSSSPEFFVELLTWIYKPRNAEKMPETSEDGEIKARLAWELLHDWRQVPGLKQDGSIDVASLHNWVFAVRTAASRVDRVEVADQHIGQLLSGSTLGEDLIGPAEPVRELIEMLANADIEEGYCMGVYNSSGVTWRGPGGNPERARASTFREAAEKLATRWPRTANMLRRMADSYEADAKREDQQSELREDLEV